jgi:hypothetical protein
VTVRDEAEFTEHNAGFEQRVPFSLMTLWAGLWIIFRDLFVSDLLVSTMFGLGMVYVVWLRPAKPPLRRFKRIARSIRISHAMVLISSARF